MSSKKVFGVLLTEQAWNELGSALEPYTSTGSLGRYIYCEEVKTGGQYFVMVATCKNTHKIRQVLPTYYPGVRHQGDFHGTHAN